MANLDFENLQDFQNFKCNGNFKFFNILDGCNRRIIE